MTRPLTKLMQFKKTILAAVVGVALFVALRLELLGPDFYAVLVVELLAFGVLLVYEGVFFVLNTSSERPSRSPYARRPAKRFRKR